MFNFFNLEPEYFSLEISGDSVKFLDIGKSGNTIKKINSKILKTNKKLIQDGIIINEEELLKILFKIRNLTKKDYVAISLPEEKSFAQVIKMPKVNKEKLEELVYYEVENYIPLSVRDVYIDFQKVESLAKQNLNHCNILLVAVPKKIVDQFNKILKKAGFSPFLFEIESLAVSRALVPGFISHNPILIIDIGKFKSRFIIFSGDSIRFTSSVNISSDNFTNTLSRKFNIDLNTAEKEKIKYGIEGEKIVHLEGTSKGFKKETMNSKTIFNAVSENLQDLVRETQEHLDYYYSHDFCENLSEEKRKIKEIILCGGGAYLKGLPEFLEKAFNMDVKLGDPLINFKLSEKNIMKSHFKNNELFFTTTIGLSLRGFIDKT